MVQRPDTLALIALHRLLVVVGIVVMPLAVLARKAGVPIPLHRLIERTDDAADRETAD